jgi:hypothetical protein
MNRRVRLYIIENTERRRCANCGGVHPFITKRCRPLLLTYLGAIELAHRTGGTRFPVTPERHLTSATFGDLATMRLSAGIIVAGHWN